MRRSGELAVNEAVSNTPDPLGGAEQKYGPFGRIFLCGGVEVDSSTPARTSTCFEYFLRTKEV